MLQAYGTTHNNNSSSSTTTTPQHVKHRQQQQQQQHNTSTSSPVTTTTPEEKTQRRRSTFYVPLIIDDETEIVVEDVKKRKNHNLHNKEHGSSVCSTVSQQRSGVSDNSSQESISTAPKKIKKKSKLQLLQKAPQQQQSRHSSDRASASEQISRTTTTIPTQQHKHKQNQKSQTNNYNNKKIGQQEQKSKKKTASTTASSTQVLAPSKKKESSSSLVFKRTPSTGLENSNSSNAASNSKHTKSSNKVSSSSSKMAPPPPCGFNWSIISDAHISDNSDTDENDVAHETAIAAALTQQYQQHQQKSNNRKNKDSGRGISGGSGFNKNCRSGMIDDNGNGRSTTSTGLQTNNNNNDQFQKQYATARMKRYGIVLNGNDDDDGTEVTAASVMQDEFSTKTLANRQTSLIAPRTHFNEDNDIVVTVPVNITPPSRHRLEIMSSSSAAAAATAVNYDAVAFDAVGAAVVDDDDSEISRMQTNTSTPIKMMKSRSRTNILSVPVPMPSLSSETMQYIGDSNNVNVNVSASASVSAIDTMELSSLNALSATKSLNQSTNFNQRNFSTVTKITLRAKSKTLPQNLSSAAMMEQAAAMENDQQHDYSSSTNRLNKGKNRFGGSVGSSQMATSNKNKISLPSTSSIITHTFPPKNLCLLKSTPRLSCTGGVLQQNPVEKYSSSDLSLQLTPPSTTTITTKATKATSKTTTSSNAVSSTSSYPIQHSMSASQANTQQQVTSPAKKSLSFIRRAHSTKLSRSNSLLKTIATQHQYNIQQAANFGGGGGGGFHGHNSGNAFDYCNGSSSWYKDFYSQYDVCALALDELDEYFQAERCTELICERFKVFNTSLNSTCDDERATSQQYQKIDSGVNDEELLDDDGEDDAGHHSDTSYEKACRRGSAPTTPILGQKQNQPEHNTTSRFTNFFSKRSNPLKRTKSVTKLERTKRGSGGLRGSRSHESLLSSHAVMSTIDLSCAGAVGVAPVHQSVLGRRHCFQVRGGPRGERYYSCGSRQERDLWIYSLRKSITPNADHTRRMDNSLKMWVYEAKNLPAKKKYFCELHLDKNLYGRTSVKLQTDLLFWGEYFDFPDIPEINVITVNVFREVEKKKKRDKYQFVGSVKIPIHEVTSRLFCEDWYPIMSEKADSLNRNGKEVIPTLRIKCRFQSTDILPINVYANFLTYLKDNYKRVCETLEPVIGVKAKEDIGQALVLLMHAQGLASAFLTDVVALDLLRVGDQRLTFRGNSLATKSMEAFLKLTGEQYLQDTLSGPINEIIQSDRDCEVDPTKATGSLQRQQASLRAAVHNAWQCIFESYKHFPPQLRACFATFRDRLQQINRQDMADNLISASIFLRFLCPAILSPSLFNITNELPSTRATRNLTLVAKTLQTLANFTRFQGKENFMEFLNDFLEQEAPRMQQFLERISTRPDHATPESILDWAGYIDQGKQLSILHTLLSESITKLPEARQSELDPLQQLLDEITKAKEHNIYLQELASHSSSLQLVSQENQENRVPEDLMVRGNQKDNGSVSPPMMQQQAQLAQPQHAVVTKPIPAERGIMRGVLTPSSLEKNIFRYNDPTVNGMLQQQQQQQQHHNLELDRRHSNSQNSIAGAQYLNKSGLQHAQSQNSMASSSLNGSSNNLLSSSANMQQQQQHCPQAPQTSAANTIERMGQYYGPTSTYASGSGISSSMSSNLSNNTNDNREYEGGSRPRTLPRGNNSAYDDLNGDFIQISGLDTNSAFVRKSPTPMLKSVVTGSGSGAPLTRSKQVTPSKLNLGIPDHSNKMHGSAAVPGIYQRTTHMGGRDVNPNSNMPMHLEDLADLFKYAEEHSTNEHAIIGGGNGVGVMVSSGVIPAGGHRSHGGHGKEQLSAKSSHCSSGYQSISTNPSPSQSSSPVESHLVVGQKLGTPLAFKNPTYQLQGGNASHLHAAAGHHLHHNQQAQKRSNYNSSSAGGSNSSYHQGQMYTSGDNATNRSKAHNGGIVAARAAFLNSGGAIDATLTPSSSDERLSSDNYHNGVAYKPTKASKPLRSLSDNHAVAHRSLSGGSSSSSSSKNINGCLATSNTRMPCGPNANYNRDDIYQSNNNNDGSNSFYVMAPQAEDIHNSSIIAQPSYMSQQQQQPQHVKPGTGVDANSAAGISGRYQRRLSLESARSLSDSSTDTEGHSQAQEGKRRRHPRVHSNNNSHIQLPTANNSTATSANTTLSINNYDQNGEIQLLQETLDTLRHTLDRDEAELRDSSDELFALTRPGSSNGGGVAGIVGGNPGLVGATNLSLQSESTMRSIIDRLITMEEELRREQLKMSLALSHKQRVIEEQGQQIAALDAANSRLLSALTALRQRYETQQQQQQQQQQGPKNPK